MLLFRSLSIGLLAACFLLQLERGQLAPPLAPPAVPSIAAAERLVTPGAATIIDVAGSVQPLQLSSLVHLDRDEHVTAVDDRAVGSDLEAGAAIAGHAGGYIDLTVASTEGTRRVLMILH